MHLFQDGAQRKDMSVPIRVVYIKTLYAKVTTRVVMNPGVTDKILRLS